jgi:hypothetical protein
MNNPNFRLGQVVINQENEIGVVIQLHEDGDCRTDMFGNCSSSEVTTATIEQIKKFRPELLEYLCNYTQLDLSKDQHLMSIRSNGNEMGHIEILGGKVVTNGFIGENTYDNFVELIKGLQGFDIKIDDFFF